MGYSAEEQHDHPREGLEAMTDTDAKSWMSCLGWGCLALVVLAVAGIGGCVWLAYKGGSDAHQTVESYLQAVAEGRFEEAYGLLGPQFTVDHRLDDLIAFERSARHELGSCPAWRLAGTSLNRESGRSTAVLTYRLDCEGGPVEAVFNLERGAEGWLIQGVGYREPGAATLPTCPACGSVVPAGARYCPSCGAALTAAAPKQDDGPQPSGAVD